MNQSIFSGPYFDYVIENTELKGAEIFALGSSAVLYEKEGRLFRLTSDGIGHNFIAEQSKKESNQAVVRFIQDFGPVAPMDDPDETGGHTPDEHYWLAEVERLTDLPKDSQMRREVIAFLEHYSDDDIIDGPDLQEILDKMQSDPFASGNTEIQSLERTLDPIVRYVIEWDGVAVLDFRDDNIMLRPSTNELVWSDPMWGPPHYLTELQENKMDDVKRRVRGC